VDKSLSQQFVHLDTSYHYTQSLVYKQESDNQLNNTLIMGAHDDYDSEPRAFAACKICCTSSMDVDSHSVGPSLAAVLKA